MPSPATPSGCAARRCWGHDVPDATQPSGLMNLVRAAAGALPFVPRGDTLPERTLSVDELSIDPANVAAYANVTGLRFGDAVPLTYPFALTFPTVMALDRKSVV